MTGLHKFIQSIHLAFVTILLCGAVLPANGQDSTVQRRPDSVQKTRPDTLSLRLSADTLDAPVTYKAADSAVLFVRDRRFLLYGRTTTTYKDVVLNAPRTELNGTNNLLTAYNDRDSLGNITTRASFEQGENKFQSDTIRYNFKTGQGLTANTFTQQQEMHIQARVTKKVDSNTIFIRDGIFTTCNYDEPHFGFHTGKLKVINGKVAVSGPTRPEFEGVPVPLYLPFGLFPLQRGRHSGLLPPQFTVTEDFGLGLEGLGYYHVLNDYLDMTLRGNVYSYGGWSVNLVPSYRKRYRYQGRLNLAYQRNKYNFKGDPDFSVIKTFNVAWSHSVDQRARPGTNFSASVNVGSTRYNQFQLRNPVQNFSNQSSSISYAKTWAGKPYNLTLAANHSQSNSTGDFAFTLPVLNFAVTTIYPFQRQDAIGTPKWYEKLGIGYQGEVQNRIQFRGDSSFTLGRLLDTLQWGARHSVPMTLALPALGPFLFSPFVSYEEQWLQRRQQQTWNASRRKIDTAYQKGFYASRSLSTGISMNTAIFGTYQFRNSRVVAIRHVIRPTIAATYVPNLNRRNTLLVQVDSSGRREEYDVFRDNVYTGFSSRKFAGLTFGLDNNLEMKVRSRNDTARNATKNVRIIDRFGINGSYNFLDSLKFTPFNLYLGTTLFEKINITAGGQLDPYDTDQFGRRVNRYVWTDGQFRPGRLTGANVSVSTQFQSKPRDPNQAPNNLANEVLNDPTLQQDRELLTDYIQRNPAEFVDFNIPWSVDLAFAFSVSRRRSPDYSSIITETSSSVNFNNSFSLTPKWNFTTTGFFDVESKQLSLFTMSVNRDLHCWQMSVNITPVGQWRSFNITVSPKSSLLQDLRINRTRVFTDF